MSGNNINLIHKLSLTYCSHEQLWCVPGLFIYSDSFRTSQTSLLVFFACGLWHRNSCCIPVTVACQRNIAIDWLSVIYFARTEEWSGHSSSSLWITSMITQALCSCSCNVLCRKWCLHEDWTIMASIVQRIMMSTVFWNGSLTHYFLFFCRSWYSWKTILAKLEDYEKLGTKWLISLLCVKKIF